jgi:hypothetical protein
MLALVVSITGCSKKIYEGRPPVVTPSERARVLRHEVSPGESLAQIADYYYGDPGQGARIAEDNELGDPDRLAAGSMLLLQFSASEWQLAQKRGFAALWKLRPNSSMQITTSPWCLSDAVSTRRPRGS